MTIAIIPARGGSQRIKNKNCADFCGKPIIYYPLRTARECGLFDKIHVSTESEAIRDVVRDLGYEVDFLRDPALADDRTTLTPVLKWVLERYRERGQDFQDVCLFFPCAPLVEASDLRQAHHAYISRNREKPVVAVTRFPNPVEWAFLRDESGDLTPCQKEGFLKRSQDLSPKYYDAGAFGFFSAKQIFSVKSVYDLDLASWLLPGHKGIDIDTPEDFHHAELIFRGMEACGQRIAD